MLYLSTTNPSFQSYFPLLYLARLGYITYPHTYTSASIPPNYGSLVHLLRRPLLAENKEGGRNRSDGYRYIPT